VIVEDGELVARSYDAVAEEYFAQLHDELSYKPLDRALLSALMEQTEPGAPIADIGCGPGHVAAWMAAHGRKAVGIDLSARMVAVGRERYPDVAFRQGDILALPAEDCEFGAAVVLYCIIHLEREDLVDAFREIRRTVRPAGLVLVSFHIGSEVTHRTEWWGRQVDLNFRFFEMAMIIEALEKAGLVLEATLERVSYSPEVETRRAYLLARRQDRSE
jgi:ubiquinone/menaquinone biosynthesis C-methylase UbiE